MNHTIFSAGLCLLDWWLHPESSPDPHGAGGVSVLERHVLLPLPG